MKEAVKIITDFFNYGILFYSISIGLSYMILAVVSSMEMIFYIRKNRFVDYRITLSSPLAPAVSILAPAYNEAKTIVENVRSLLLLHYSKFEVIIINDGSKDETLEKMIGTFELEKVNFAYNEQIRTKEVRGVYKSRNSAYGKLVVVDKVNGGKADAINVGINVASCGIFACIDVDCILEQDALLKMVKPFMEQGERRVIASGGVVRIANSCKVEYGKITKVNMPREFLPRIQVLEYFRAFLLARMAWSRMNGLILISGAFGFFDREIAVKAGGYHHATVGEDMELVVRMRRYMEEQKLKYRVRFIPDPLCWTEAPSTGRILGRQRNRWTRGTFETLWLHRKVLFNRKYGFMGLVSMPYYFLYEWLAPFIEFFGIIFFLIFTILGYTNWVYFFSLLALVYVFAVTFSIFSILFEELSFHQYKSPGDILLLVAAALAEPVVYHPRVVWWAIKGNYDLYRGKKAWGDMVRTGF
jgi:poly-beta-1,6-N-acetyl-D-glucosamine synthase